MKGITLAICFLLSLSAFASEVNSTSASLDNLTGTFDSGSAMSFSTNLGKSLVVECNGSYGLVGLSDENYVAYNRIVPAHVVTIEECKEILVGLNERKETLTFSWEKTTCGYFGCKYETAYELK